MIYSGRYNSYYRSDISFCQGENYKHNDSSLGNSIDSFSVCKNYLLWISNCKNDKNYSKSKSLMDSLQEIQDILE